MRCPTCKGRGEVDEMPRTIPQNSSLHVFCTRLANTLNDMGLDMHMVLKSSYRAWWDMYSVKNHIWRPFMKAIAHVKSTKDLKKTDGKIKEIHETIMRELGEVHHVPFIPWPAKCEAHDMVECSICGSRIGEN